MKSCSLAADGPKDKWGNEEDVDADDDVGHELVRQLGDLGQML